MYNAWFNGGEAICWTVSLVSVQTKIGSKVFTTKERAFAITFWRFFFLRLIDTVSVIEMMFVIFAAVKISLSNRKVMPVSQNNPNTNQTQFNKDIVNCSIFASTSILYGIHLYMDGLANTSIEDIDGQGLRVTVYLLADLTLGVFLLLVIPILCYWKNHDARNFILANFWQYV